MQDYQNSADGVSKKIGSSKMSRRFLSDYRGFDGDSIPKNLREIFCIVDEFETERVGYVFVGDVAVDGVETFGKPGVLLASRLPAFAREFQSVRQSCVVSASVDVLETAPGILATE